MVHSRVFFGSFPRGIAGGTKVAKHPAWEQYAERRAEGYEPFTYSNELKECFSDVARKRKDSFCFRSINRDSELIQAGVNFGFREQPKESARKPKLLKTLAPTSIHPNFAELLMYPNRRNQIIAGFDKNGPGTAFSVFKAVRSVDHGNGNSFAVGFSKKPCNLCSNEPVCREIRLG